jgi:hypothetical protein
MTTEAAQRWRINSHIKPVIQAYNLFPEKPDSFSRGWMLKVMGYFGLHNSSPKLLSGHPGFPVPGLTPAGLYTF